jgi:hypothetical protein
MDPITVVITALVSGAAAAVKPTAEKAVMDAYNGIKALIVSRYKGVEIATLERDPASKTRKELVKEGLEAAKAGEDAELLSQAQAVIDAVREHAPSSAKAAGVSIEDLEAQSLYVRRLVASGGLKLKNAKLERDVVFEDVTLGDSGSKA